MHEYGCTSIWSILNSLEALLSISQISGCLCCLMAVLSMAAKTSTATSKYTPNSGGLCSPIFRFFRLYLWPNLIIIPWRTVDDTVDTTSDGSFLHPEATWAGLLRSYCSYYELMSRISASVWPGTHSFRFVKIIDRIEHERNPASLLAEDRRRGMPTCSKVQSNISKSKPTCSLDDIVAKKALACLLRESNSNGIWFREHLSSGFRLCHPMRNRRDIYAGTPVPL